MNNLKEGKNIISELLIPTRRRVICLAILVILALGIFYIVKTLSNNSYSKQSSLHPGLFSVKNSNDIWGAVNGEGKLVIPFNFSFLGTFADGLAPAAKKGQKLLGYVNKSGQFVYKPQFFIASPF